MIIDDEIFTIGVNLQEFKDPEYTNLVRINGYITVVIESSEDEDEFEHKEVGTFSAYLIDWGNFKNALTECDAEDVDLIEFAGTILNKHGEYKTCVAKTFEKQFDYPDKTLFLSRMSIDPKFNGIGLGLIAIDKVIKWFGKQCDLIACLPCPILPKLANEEAMNALVEKYDLHHQTNSARKKLRSYWQRLGFIRLGNTGYIGMDYLGQMDRPNITDVLANLD